MLVQSLVAAPAVLAQVGDPLEITSESKLLNMWPTIDRFSAVFRRERGRSGLVIRSSKKKTTAFAKAVGQGRPKCGHFGDPEFTEMSMQPDSESL